MAISRKMLAEGRVDRNTIMNSHITVIHTRKKSTRLETVCKKPYKVTLPTESKNGNNVWFISHIH